MAGSDPNARRAELEAKAATILAADHFAALGVSTSADPRDVQRAYISAVKLWHPDRVPEGFTELRPLFAKVFSKLEEARATLSDPARRLAYVANAKASANAEGAPSSQRVPVAAMPEAQVEYRKAETFLKRNDPAQAEAHLRRAVGLDPKKVEYQAALAWVEASKPGCSDARVKELVAQLDGLIAKESDCERALFWRGSLRKRLGMIPKAMEDFARAAELDPKNVDAAREVRIYRMRSPGGDAKGGDAGGVGGFFKKLFKR